MKPTTNTNSFLIFSVETKFTAAGINSVLSPLTRLYPKSNPTFFTNTLKMIYLSHLTIFKLPLFGKTENL